MGKVYINSDEIGTFSPQAVGASGTIWLNSTEIGTFPPLEVSGKVYVDGIEVGTYVLPAGVTEVTIELGVQWGLLVWSPSLNKWLRAGTPIT